MYYHLYGDTFDWKKDWGIPDSVAVFITFKYPITKFIIYTHGCAAKTQQEKHVLWCFNNWSVTQNNFNIRKIWKSENNMLLNSDFYLPVNVSLWYKATLKILNAVCVLLSDNFGALLGFNNNN